MDDFVNWSNRLVGVMGVINANNLSRSSFSHNSLAISLQRILTENAILQMLLQVTENLTPNCFHIFTNFTTKDLMNILYTNY